MLEERGITVQDFLANLSKQTIKSDSFSVVIDISAYYDVVALKNAASCGILPFENCLMSIVTFGGKCIAVADTRCHCDNVFLLSLNGNTD